MANCAAGAPSIQKTSLVAIESMIAWRRGLKRTQVIQQRIRQLKFMGGALLLLCMAAPNAPAQTGAKVAEAKSRTEIRHLIEVYMQAVDDADPKLAATVFLTTQDASFISPVGDEHGWNQIADDVFEKLMGQTFSKRHLAPSGEPVIQVFGDAAVAEFNWNFHAVLRGTGAPVQTSGRESQFYVKFADKGWKLVHVHYSGPAVAPPATPQS